MAIDEPTAALLTQLAASGLPPAIVVLEEHDVLRSEGEVYADRLRTAGVPIVQRCFAGQRHASSRC